MQWKVDFDESSEFVRAKQWDEFNLDEQARFLTDIFRDPKWRPGLGVLFDYRGLNVRKLDDGDLTAISTIFQSARRRLEDSKLALLCDNDDLFEVGKHFGMLIAPKLENNLIIFRDEAAAISWLKARR